MNAGRWLLMAVAACLEISCSTLSQDEEGSASGGRELVFRTVSGDDAPLMEQGSTVGLFLTSVTTGEVLRRNELVVVGENGTPAHQLDLLESSAPDDYEFFAYSPYDNSWDDILDSVLEFEVSADQSSDKGYEASDLMLAYDIRHNDKGDEVLFSHVMAKIILHVTDRTGMFDMISSGAVLHGLRCGAYVYMADGACQANDADPSDIKCHMLDSRDRRASLSAVVPPQELDGGKLAFSLLLGGAEYSFSIADVQLLSGEKVYIYSLRMTDRGLELEDSTIADWEDDGGGSFNVAFE